MSTKVQELKVNEDVGGEVKQKKQKKRRAPQPLSVFTKTSIAVFLIHITLLVALGLAVRQGVVLILAGFELLIVALMVTGVRWTPIIGSIFGGLVLSIFLFATGYPIHHLTHPKDAFGYGTLTTLSFVVFTGMILLFWTPAMMLVSGIAAVIQNYFQHPRQTPSWYKTALTAAICIVIGAFLLGSLQQPDPVAATAAPGTVYLNAGSFSVSTITISKGSNLTLIDSGAYHHKISDGSWVSGQPTYSQQAGQPLLRNWDVDASGTSKVIGPFTTSGTYHLFCSIHTGMTLTIIVQ